MMVVAQGGCCCCCWYQKLKSAVGIGIEERGGDISDVSYAGRELVRCISR